MCNKDYLRSVVAYIKEKLLYGGGVTLELNGNYSLCIAIPGSHFDYTYIIDDHVLSYTESLPSADVYAQYILDDYWNQAVERLRRELFRKSPISKENTNEAETD